MVQNIRLRVLGLLGIMSIALIFGLLYTMDNQIDQAEPEENAQKNVITEDEPQNRAQDEFENDSSFEEDEPLQDDFSSNTPPSSNSESKDFSEPNQPTNEDLRTTVPMSESTNDNNKTFPEPPTPLIPTDSTTNELNSNDELGNLAPTANQLSLKPKYEGFFPQNQRSNEMKPNKNPNINIGLNDNSRSEMTTALQKLLSDEYVLYTKTLNFHWNIEGKHFGPLHALFNEQYEKLQSIIDSIAERIRAIGSFTRATMKEFLDLSSLTEEANVFPDDITMLSTLLADHENVIQTIRKANDIAVKINDGGSNNFLSGLLEAHEKIAWMLRAHLNR